MRFSYASDPRGRYWLVVDRHNSDDVVAVHATASSAAIDAHRLEDDWRHRTLADGGR